MKLYTQYVNNYSHALVTLVKCKDRPAFREWLAVLIPSSLFPPPPNKRFFSLSKFKLVQIIGNHQGGRLRPRYRRLSDPTSSASTPLCITITGTLYNFKARQKTHPLIP